MKSEWMVRMKKASGRSVSDGSGDSSGSYSSGSCDGGV